MSRIQEVAGNVTISRGQIAQINETGMLISVDNVLIHCQEWLSDNSISPTFCEGDAVLVLLQDDMAVVLGRLMTAHSGLTEPVNELILEAKHSLTLKVGDGSITIREDGRILIKGKDLVSHAKRMNRIRGGSVQIN